jgi:hypothetical protein
MLRSNQAFAMLASLTLLIAVSGCDDDDDGGLGPPPTSDVAFVQIERLGNPLVSEVTFPKRDHGFHNTTEPRTDVDNGFRGIVEAFVTGVAGRPPELATTLSNVLIPDVLIVQTDRPGTTAGWLTWALEDGYGGRRLDEDVVDIALSAIFGTVLSDVNASPGLSSQNVPGNDVAFSSGFPYLGARHQ